MPVKEPNTEMVEGEEGRQEKEKAEELDSDLDEDVEDSSIEEDVDDEQPENATERRWSRIYIPRGTTEVTNYRCLGRVKQRYAHLSGFKLIGGLSLDYYETLIMGTHEKP